MAKFQAGRLLAAAGVLMAAGPGNALAAGDWIFGSSLVAPPSTIVYFARNVSPGAPGQMVVRCMTGDGLTIDASAFNQFASANPGPTPSGEISIRLTWAAEAGAAPRVETVDAVGEPRARSDGAIVVTIAGPEAISVGKGLVEMPEKIEVIAGGVTAELSVNGMADAVGTVARLCNDWPD